VNLKRFFPLALILCLLLAACGQENNAQNNQNPVVSLRIFAAASLTESFNEIKSSYHAKHPNVDITYNFAGSQALVEQMKNGAGADIFASADQTNMQKASAAGLVTESKVFAYNKLVVIVPAGNPGKISTLKDLAQSGLKIDVADATVPVGKYTLQVLDKLGKSSDYGPTYEQSVKANFVSHEDNVKSVVNKVQLGEVDAGFVYKTDVTPANSSKVSLIEIPDSFNVIAEYPIAVTKQSANASASQDFVQYVLSSDGQATLTKYHFTSVNG
jgi:molybdate transport system substrate-binding protein